MSTNTENCLANRASRPKRSTFVSVQFNSFHFYSEFFIQSIKNKMPSHIAHKLVVVVVVVVVIIIGRSD